MLMLPIESMADITQMSVLLVDDDPFTCDICRIVFQHHALPLEIRVNAAEALDYLKYSVPDVIILDLVLPDLDGYQSLAIIRQLPKGGDCKVVATTAYYTSTTHHEVMRHGFDGYLPKPLSVDGLIPYLKSLL